jgi:hypothetical protein
MSAKTIYHNGNIATNATPYFAEATRGQLFPDRRSAH